MQLREALMHSIARRDTPRNGAAIATRVSDLYDALTNLDAAMVEVASRKRRRWDAKELRYLDTWAGVRPISEMCLRLRRSERALRCQLYRRGLSAKVREGWGLEQLRVDLHLCGRKVFRYVVDGILHVQSAQIYHLALRLGDGFPDRHLRVSHAIPISETAHFLKWPRKRVLAAAMAGRCRIINVRITDASVMRLGASDSFASVRARLRPAIDHWLKGPDKVEVIREMHPPEPHHLKITHHCATCGRYVRGIAFFRHKAHCGEVVEC
jgi:hypothetical protein